MKQPLAAVLHPLVTIVLCALLAGWPMAGASAEAAPGQPLAQADAPGDPSAPESASPNEAAPETDQDGANDPGHAPNTSARPDYVPPAIERDVGKLPFPTRRMRELLIEAARSGDIERLRPYIGSGDDMTLLSFGGIEDDPIAFLKSVSGDEEGHEVLAILLELLESGYVHVEEGTENEMYIWPYFYAQPLDKLTPPQRVELFTLLTSGDYEDMLSFGAYIFYRVGITPQGRWRFFVTGD